MTATENQPTTSTNNTQYPTRNQLALATLAVLIHGSIWIALLTLIY